MSFRTRRRFFETSRDGRNREKRNEPDPTKLPNDPNLPSKSNDLPPTPTVLAIAQTLPQVLPSDPNPDHLDRLCSLLRAGYEDDSIEHLEGDGLLGRVEDEREEVEGREGRESGEEGRQGGAVEGGRRRESRVRGRGSALDEREGREGGQKGEVDHEVA